ncbi:hypothetical protein ACHAPT_009308 [Fusarium lateritium]
MIRSTPPRNDSLPLSSYFRNSPTPSHHLNERPQSSLSHSPGYTAPGTTPEPGAPRSSTARPGTSLGRTSRNATVSSILGNAEVHSVICAVSEARGVSPAVGIACVNASIGEVLISQISDNQSYVKTIHALQVAAPSRILFTSTACPPNKPSNLYSLATDLVSDAQIVAQDRSAWCESDGLECISNLAFKDDIEPLKVATQGKFYAISCLAAAMKYIQRHFSFNFVPHSLRIQYRPSEDTMMIDISAIQSLEIMQNLRNPKSKHSLFGLMNHTLTPMGARMLRSSILQPPTCDLSIEPRYDALHELTTNEELFREVRKALKLFHDTEKLLTKLIIIPDNVGVQQLEEQINHVLMVKSFLDAVSKLYTALQPATSELLVKVRALCRPELTSRSLEKIHRSIEPDVTYMKSALDLRNRRTFAVKTGINGMLDVARQTYKEVTEETIGDSFVPNDYFAGEQSGFHVVTGCNMSGKSTYIRAVALLQIMAQIGSFVPAEFAAFSIIHNIFARVSLDDNIGSNLSTFSVEMREMAFILRNIDDKSIAVIDELGRATSNRDGLAIAIAMSEALIQSNALVWFATHFTDLTRVFVDRPGVMTLHLAATTSTAADGLPHITMLYKATQGTVGDEHYGINLARAIGLPQGFIEKAEEVAKDLRQTREMKRNSGSSRLVTRRNLILNLWANLKRGRDSGDEDSLPMYLKQLQAEFILRMEELDSR